MTVLPRLEIGSNTCMDWGLMVSANLFAPGPMAYFLLPRGSHMAGIVFSFAYFFLVHCPAHSPNFSNTPQLLILQFSWSYLSLLNGFCFLLLFSFTESQRSPSSLSFSWKVLFCHFKWCWIVIVITNIIQTLSYFPIVCSSKNLELLKVLTVSIHFPLFSILFWLKCLTSVAENYAVLCFPMKSVSLSSVTLLFVPTIVHVLKPAVFRNGDTNSLLTL